MLVTDSPEVPSPPEDPYPVPGPQEPPVLRPHTVNHPQVLVTEVGAWSREVQTKYREGTEVCNLSTSSVPRRDWKTLLDSLWFLSVVLDGAAGLN